jgi:hypothetical protein
MLHRAGQSNMAWKRETRPDMGRDRRVILIPKEIDQRPPMVAYSCWARDCTR